MILAPYIMPQFFDNNGNPLSGGKLFTYAAGTTTKLATYTDSTGTVPNTNPVIMNTRGEPLNGGVWVPAGVAYKFVLAPSTDSDPPTNAFWTVDNAASDSTAPLATGFLFGLTLSNGAAPTTDINIAVGKCRSSDDSYDLNLASLLTKQLNVAWAPGTNAGGLDTGAVANGTYHVFVIARTDTNAVDGLFSLSATSPTMPAGYTVKRRIGSILREAGAIVAFTQVGDLFRRVTKTENTSVAGAGSALTTLGVPLGIKVLPILGKLFNPAASSSATFTLGSASTGSADVNVFVIATDAAAAASLTMLLPSIFETNTSAQLYTAQTVVGTLVSAALYTHGWYDSRGRTA